MVIPSLCAEDSLIWSSLLGVICIGITGGGRQWKFRFPVPLRFVAVFLDGSSAYEIGIKGRGAALAVNVRHTYVGPVWCETPIFPSLHLKGEGLEDLWASSRSFIPKANPMMVSADIWWQWKMSCMLLGRVYQAYGKHSGVCPLLLRPSCEFLHLWHTHASILPLFIPVSSQFSKHCIWDSSGVYFLTLRCVTDACWINEWNEKGWGRKRAAARKSPDHPHPLKSKH